MFTVILSLFLLAFGAALVLLPQREGEHGDSRRKNMTEEKADPAGNLICQNNHEEQAFYHRAVMDEIIGRIRRDMPPEEILEVVAGSLDRLVRSSAVAYLALRPREKAYFKCYIKEPLSHSFVDQMKNILFRASKILGEPVAGEQVEEARFGDILDDNPDSRVEAFFILPLLIEDRPAGFICVASARSVQYTLEETAALYEIIEHAGQVAGRVNALLREEINQTRSMLSSMSDGFIMVNASGKTPVINRKAREILGLLEREEISILDVIQALYGIFDFRGANEEIMKSAKEKIYADISLKNTFYKITGAPVRNRAGHIAGLAFIFSDITQEKRIEAMKNEFISITSHQLRTPLSSIKWFLEMLLNGDLGEMPEKQRNILADVYRSNERIITLVNDLLDVSRLEADKVKVEPTPTNLIEFMKSMLVDLEPMFQNRKQIFEFKKPESLPRVNTDPKLVWQVAQNMLSNASKYTPSNGRVDLELVLHNDKVIISVADTGLGIPAFQQQRIFEKFFRADNTGKEEGTGLGMYISRKLAEALGGELSFKSEEGKGTVFYFTIPLNSDKFRKTA